MKCFRGKCGWTEGFRLKNEQGPKTYRKPEVRHADIEAKAPDWLYEWFAARKIRSGIVDRFGVYVAPKWFSKEIGEADAIVFPFFWKGEVINRKYRHPVHKRPQAQEKDALPTLFNADIIPDNLEEVIWVEGEPDVMAIAECGVYNVVTLKDGAPPEGSSRNDSRLDALGTHAEALAKVKRFVLAGDTDVPGRALREALASRLGRHRCWIVDWPDGCKDAGDVLMRLGPDAVTQALAGAQPYPIAGVQRVVPGTLERLYERPAPGVMGTGMYPVDKVLKLPMEGRLIIVTGYPGGGKSSWIRSVMIHTAEAHDRRWGVFSPEMQPWEDFVAECAEVRTGKTFRYIPGYQQLSKEERAEANDWMFDRVTMLVLDAARQRPTLDWLLETAEALVLQYGMTDFLIDPWNHVDHSRALGMTETEFIGAGLQRCASFGLRFGCNMWISVHPAKPMPTTGAAKGAPPGPYDCHGSAHWFNRADIGITVHSPSPGQAEVHRWKARKMRHWGGTQKSAALDFDHNLGRYSTPVTVLGDEPVAKPFSETD